MEPLLLDVPMKETISKDPWPPYKGTPVLVRDKVDEPWKKDIFLYEEHCNYKFRCSKEDWSECIPYKGNEHFLGTTKSWE